MIKKVRDTRVYDILLMDSDTDVMDIGYKSQVSRCYHSDPTDLLTG